MGSSSKSKAAANKSSGPQSTKKPGTKTLPCQQNNPPPTLAQTVTPLITVVALPNDATGTAWFHKTVKPEQNQVRKITISATKAGDELSYAERGSLTWTNANVRFYYGSNCKGEVANGANFKFSELLGGVDLYYKGEIEGTTDLTLTLAPADDPRITVQGPAMGQVQAREANVLTPKIELEYKVALLDRKPHTGATNADTSAVAAKPPTPTYMYLSYTQSNPLNDKPFTTGAKLTGADANLDVYTDEACTTVATLTALDNAQLGGFGKLQLWARGKAVSAAPFTLTLTLTPPEEPWFRFMPPATETFNVGELKMIVHKHDQTAIGNLSINPDVPAPDPYTLDKQLKAYHDLLDAAVIPDQIALTDAEKTGPGRFLHTQGNDGSFGRAKVELAQLVAAQWPAETDAYLIRLGEDFDSGRVNVFDQETGPAPMAPLTVAQLKAAKVVVWVEGATDSDKRGDTRLELGIDRADGGLAKTPKKFGDWARFDVVTITEVKVFYTPVPDTPVAWDETNGRFYINCKPDPEGRKVTIRAKLTKNIAGVPIHFMLVPSASNMKTANWGVDLPDSKIKIIGRQTGKTAPSGTDLGKAKVQKTTADVDFIWKWNEISPDLKHKDKDARTKLLHMSEPSKSDPGNAFAFADKELILSRFGGDQFIPAAYISEDPQLAKFVDEHPKLKLRAPVTSLDAIAVWRQFWYQRIAVEGFKTNPGFRHQDFQTTIDVYEEVMVKLDKTDADHDISAVTLNNMNPRAAYPRYMVIPNTADLLANALVVSDTNKGQFWPGAAPPKTPLRVPILVCDAQWDPDGVTDAITTPFAPKDGGAFVEVPLNSGGATARAMPVDVGKDTLIPPLQGGDLFVSGKYQVREKIGGGGWANLGVVNLTNADVFIPYQSRADIQQIYVKWPAAVVDEWVLQSVTIASGGAAATPAMVGTTVSVLGAATTAAQITITGVVGTAVTAINVTNQGRYTAQLAGPLATSGASGLTVTPTWLKIQKQVRFGNLVVKGAAHFLGECQDGRLLAVYDPNEVADFSDTVVHECGHACAQAPQGTPPGPSATHATIPAHPNTKDLGKGNHCWYEAGTQKTKIAWAIAAVTITAGGTGYGPADVDKSGAFTTGTFDEERGWIKVTSVTAGVVDGVSITRAGKYTTKPPNPVTLMGGDLGGNGLQVTLNWVEKDVDTGMKDADAIAPCVMYDSGPQARGIHKFCAVCTPYLLAQDMSAFK